MTEDMPEPVASFIEPFDRTVYFQTQKDMVNVQSLGISLAETTELGEYYHLFNDIDGDAVFYYCTESDYFEHGEKPPEGVLMYAQGTGWYCAYDMDGLNTVEDWFYEKFEEFIESSLTFSAFENYDS